MTRNPFFSVCVPAFNAESFLQQTIESVLAQSFTDFELIVLDNASTDRTSEIIKSFHDPRIRPFNNSKTISAADNWSRVISLAKGQWTKLLCADDVLHVDCLKNSFEEISTSPNVVLVSLTRSIIDDRDRIHASEDSLHRKSICLLATEVPRTVMRRGRNIFGEGLCVVWRSDLTRKVGGFSNNWNYAIDIDYWLRLSVHGKVRLSTKPAGSFRISKGAWTSQLLTKAPFEMSHFFLSHDLLKASRASLKIRALFLTNIRSIARIIFLKIKL